MPRSLLKNTNFNTLKSMSSSKTISEMSLIHQRLKSWDREWTLANLVKIVLIYWFALVPNELIIDLVKTRLEKPDCKINGWILDGCPTTNEQIAALNDLGFVPSLVITLDQSDSSVYEKIEQRRFDPVEFKHYNLLLDEIPEDAQYRLIQQREHTHPIVKRRLQEYRNFLSTVET